MMSSSAFRSLGILIAALVMFQGCRPAAPPSLEELARTTNLGKAYLETRESRPAVEAFSKAVELARSSAPAWRNLARAELLAEDSDAALEALERAARLERESPATSYLTGLTYVRQSRFEEALPHFETAVRLDPLTAALRYQLANAYQAAERHEEAREHLLATLELDPLHTGSHYKLFAYARDPAERQARFREFNRLLKIFGEDNRSPVVLEQCVYTEAEILSASRGPAPSDTRPATEVRFVDATEETFRDDADRAALAEATTAAVLDVDREGAISLLVTGPGGASRISSGPDGTLIRTALDLPAVPAEPFEVVVGNFHDVAPEGTPFDPELHAHNDVLLVGLGGARLLAGRGANSFEDVTAAAGLDGLRARRARWVDYENDGDLDLLAAGETGLELWQNNSDGRFEEVAAAVGIEPRTDGPPPVDVAAMDLNGNLAVDLVAAHGTGPTRVLENRRTGLFRERPDPPGPWPAGRRVLVGHLDGDGRPDAVLVGDQAVVVIPGGSTDRSRLELDSLDPSAAVLFDFDNDGALDLAVAGRDRGAEERGRLRLWRNAGDATWSDVTAAAGLEAADQAAVHDLRAADLDNDGDTDLILLTAGGLRWLRNDGGQAGGQLKVRLVGTKTNPNGFGVRLEVRRNDFHAVHTVTDLPVEIGLGDRQALDTVRVVWTNGIVDNQIDVPADAPLTLVEQTVAAGSCPFLYAWDGRGFRFVTDILGNSPLGLSLRRGVPLDADPDELVRIGDSQDLVPRDGAYVLQVTEEMREVLYLDQAELIAVDHPPGVEVHGTDKLMPAPFPPSELVGIHSLRSALAVEADDGLDRGAALEAIDGVFAPPGLALPPPLRGMTRTLALTLDFGPLDTSREWILALTGWLQYGDASTNIALSQGPAERVVPPRLEAETAAGWQSLDVIVGMPAGKTKTILVDLAGQLPPGSRRLRLTTSVEIRWDRIALGERSAPSAVAQHALAPMRSTLAWRGFSEIRSRAPGHPTTPEFAAVSPRPPWQTALSGFLTRYGDVGELTAVRDDRLVLVGAGDALELAFDADLLPPIPAGRVRTFFFYSVGWDKDGDVNVIDGDTVAPLPVTAEDDAWQLVYNTRYVPWDRFTTPATAARR